MPASSGVLPTVTLVAAILAAGAASLAAWLQRKTGIATVEAALKSVEVSQAKADSDRERAVEDARSKLYQDAAQQLGHPEAPVRFAGVYALTRLADEWPAQRSSCVEVLCAYLRMPVRKMSDGNEDRSDLSVRRSIQRVIREHLQDGLSVSWSDLRFNFRGAHLDSLWLEGAIFNRQVEFDGATFLGQSTSLRRTVFNEGASMRGVQIHTMLDIAPNLIGNSLDLSDSTVAPDANLIFEYQGHTPTGARIDLSRIKVRARATVNVEIGNPQVGSTGVRLIAALQT